MKTTYHNSDREARIGDRVFARDQGGQPVVLIVTGVDEARGAIKAFPWNPLQQVTLPAEKCIPHDDLFPPDPATTEPQAG